MLRYFVIATVLVVGVIVGVTAYHHYHLTIRVGRGHGRPSKSVFVPRAQHLGNGNLYGDAPWALSALPECMMQVEEWKGPHPSALTAHLPKGAQRFTSPAVLHYSDCTLSIRSDEAFVQRRGDRFRIPRPASFYRYAAGIALLQAAPCRRGKRCGWTLRIYRTAQP